MVPEGLFSRSRRHSAGLCRFFVFVLEARRRVWLFAPVCNAEKKKCLNKKNIFVCDVTQPPGCYAKSNNNDNNHNSNNNMARLYRCVTARIGSQMIQAHTLISHLFNIRRIWSSQGGQYEDGCLLGWLIALMMERARTSETFVNFYQTTRRYNPEDSHFRYLTSILISSHT
jgi:hypothetical protein